MDYSGVIVELYNTVYEKQKSKFCVDSGRIRSAIQNMKEVYMPNRNWEYDEISKVANYNDPALRCAYLHKYAMIHTGLMCEVLQSAFGHYGIHHDIDSKAKLNLCSLGGGPGTDIVGLLFILREVFGYIQCNVTVIDHAIEWKHVFDSIVSELKTGRYGSVRDMVSGWNFSYDYLSADLLAFSFVNNYKVLQAIKNADIITMIKFISAAACEKTRQMVQVKIVLLCSIAILVCICP